MKAAKNVLIGLAGFIAGGASYLAQYLVGGKVAGFSVLYFTVSFTLLLTFLLAALLANEVPIIAMFFTGSVLLAVIVKFFYDIQFVDPTLHNLLPFEIGIYLLAISPAAFAGALLGKWAKKQAKKNLKRR